MSLAYSVSPHPAHILCVVLLAISSAFAQAPAAPPPETESLQESIRDLREQVRELRSAVTEMKTESARYREETLALRQELQQARSLWPSQGTAAVSAQADSTSRDQASVTQRVVKLEEDQQLLAGKVDDQYQTKIESASKYKVRFSGIVLFNLAGNSGRVDDIDVPMLAFQNNTFNHGSFTGTLRQSQLGFEAFGPLVFGARSSANVQFDFGGGSPSDLNGATFGIARLRVGTVNLDWANTSLVGGQDALFFSPNSPTSFATLAIPALAYSGNLWSWTPQLRIEHRFNLTGGSKFVVQGGILDPLTGEPPNAESFQFYRVPQAGESTRQPGYATRIAWSHPASGDAITLGVGTYYSRQNWGFSRNINAWAGTADWNVPLGRRFAVSGEFYRGRAIGGLGGSLGRSVIWDRPLSDPTAIVLPFNSIGGWTQLKFKAAPKLEFNAAFGQDSTFASDLNALANEFSYLDANLARNRATFGNVIYRPRSDLLFAFEYRRLHTADAYGMNQNVNHLNLSMGVLF